MSDDELTKPLLENDKVVKEGEKENQWEDYESEEDEKGVKFNTKVRASGVEYTLDGPKTISTGVKKKVRKTRFGTSGNEKLTRPGPELWQSIDEQDNAVDEKNKERNCFGEWSMDNVNGDKKSCCGEKCTILGGKKTKRRRYNKKQSKRNRSRKSRRSKKRSKNNKK